MEISEGPFFLDTAVVVKKRELLHFVGIKNRKYPFIENVMQVLP